MKYLLLLSLFFFTFAKSSFAAVPGSCVLSGISATKDSVIYLSQSEYKSLLKAKKEALRALKTTNIIANIGLGILTLAVVMFVAFFAGFGFVLAGILILIGSLMTIYLMIKMRKINKILRKYPLLETDPAIADRLYLASAKLGILCAIYGVLFLSTILLMISQGIFFSLFNPVVIIASITALIASIFSTVFFKINKKLK